MNDNFKFIIPAELIKNKDGDWKVSGLASTPSIDRQGEVIVPDGIDATPIDQGKGFFNFDHDNSPESTLGTLDSYKKSSAGFHVQGRLFKNHSRAKAVYEIMSSLGKADKGRVGMSVEGKVVERDPMNPKIIKRCVIKNVALTLNPVNQDTYADIIKSMSTDEAQIEFESTGKPEVILSNDSMAQPVEKAEPTFTASQVVSMIEKALGVGAGYASAPNQLSGGDALATEEVDKGGPGSGKQGHTTAERILARHRALTESRLKQVQSEKHGKAVIEGKQAAGAHRFESNSAKQTTEARKLRRIGKSEFQKSMIDILDQLQKLYPDNSRSEIWEVIKDRVEKKYPEIKEL